MEIVDAQVHLNHLGRYWDRVERDLAIDYSIVLMDALGVDAVLIDEWNGWDDHLRHLPGYLLPNGVMRSQLPFSQRAVELHPDRFGYVARIDPRDPDMEQLMADVRRHPGGLCIRIVAFEQTGDLELFLSGGYDALLASAQRHQVPIFCWFPHRSHQLEPALQKFPDLQFILDHCGVDSTLENSLSERITGLDQVMSLAKYPNLALKWCHAPGQFSAQPYPYPDAIQHLRRTIDAFTPQRLMWGSDHTQSKIHHTWAQAIYHIIDSDALSDAEKEWIMARTIRTILRWPAQRTTGAGSAL